MLSVQLTTSRIGNHIPIDAQSATTCDDHNICIPTHIRTYTPPINFVSQMSTVPVVNVRKGRCTKIGPCTQSLDLINSILTQR